MHLLYPLVLAALLFAVGVYGLLLRRNAVLVLMSVELMLNAVNLLLVAFDVQLRDTLHTGQSLALFVIALGVFLGLGLGWAGAAVISASLSARSGIALSATLAGKELAMAAAVLVIGMLLAVIPSWSSCRESVSSGLRT